MNHISHGVSREKAPNTPGGIGAKIELADGIRGFELSHSSGEVKRSQEEMILPGQSVLVKSLWGLTRRPHLRCIR